MPVPTYNIPIANTDTSTEEPKVITALSALKTLLTAGVDTDNMAAAANIAATQLVSTFRDAVGTTDGSTTRRDTATVATEQTTTSTTWADLATVGPSVTITVPSNALVLVGVQAELKHSSTVFTAVGVHEATDFPISGIPEGSNVAGGNLGGEAWIVRTPNAANSYTALPYIATRLIPATAGSRTYTLKYSTDSGTATFKNRTIWALALGGF